MEARTKKYSKEQYIEHLKDQGLTEKEIQGVIETIEKKEGNKFWKKEGR